MSAAIATLSLQYSIANCPVPIRHAAVKYLGLVYLYQLFNSDLNKSKQERIDMCRDACKPFISRIILDVNGKTINVSQFCGGKSGGTIYNDHDPALMVAGASFLGMRSKKKRNLVFLMVGCEYGSNILPPATDDWVVNKPFG
jgi:hypothetical protein